LPYNSVYVARALDDIFYIRSQGTEEFKADIE